MNSPDLIFLVADISISEGITKPGPPATDHSRDSSTSNPQVKLLLTAALLFRKCYQFGRKLFLHQQCLMVMLFHKALLGKLEWIQCCAEPM